MKKFVMAALAAGTLALGMAGAAAPANAQVYFGIGPSWGWGGPGYYGGPYYRHHFYGGPGHRHYTCWTTRVWHHHHWNYVRRCGWTW